MCHLAIETLVGNKFAIQRHYIFRIIFNRLTYENMIRYWLPFTVKYRKYLRM